MDCPQAISGVNYHGDKNLRVCENVILYGLDILLNADVASSGKILICGLNIPEKMCMQFWKIRTLHIVLISWC